MPKVLRSNDSASAAGPRSCSDAGSPSLAIRGRLELGSGIGTTVRTGSRNARSGDLQEDDDDEQREQDAADPEADRLPPLVVGGLVVDPRRRGPGRSVDPFASRRQGSSLEHDLDEVVDRGG